MRIALSCIVSLSLLGCQSVQHGDGQAPEFAPIRNLPAEARHVSYHLPDAPDAERFYEFDTSEAGFRTWAQQWKHLHMQEQSAPFNVRYFNAQLQQAASRPVASGVRLDWLDGAKGVHLAYDRDAGRAYYHSHTTAGPR